MKCNICNKHKAKIKDYRFIDSVGLQGSVLACKLCFNLSDVAIVDIKKNNLDPRIFFEEK
tara:strand:- start:33 stop:212 length:180 start_codon:yes stop_codon:yes gene_type:complete